MNDQGAVLSALVVRVAEVALVLLLIRVAGAVVLAAAARALAHRPAGSSLAAAAVRLAPRFARGTVITVIGASIAVALPSVGAHAADAPRVPVLDRVVATADPAPTAVPRPSTPHRPPRPATAYEVRRGDSLWSIAAHALGPRPAAHDVAEAWPRWYAANRAVIGDDARLLRPGQRLESPAPAATTQDGR